MITSFKNNKGFNLVELMVTVAIIGSLATSALGSYDKTMQRVRDNRRIQDMSTIKKALLAFYLDQDRWPGAPEGISLAGVMIGNGGNFDIALSNYFAGGIPRDPLHDSTIYFYSYDPSHIKCDGVLWGMTIAFNKGESGANVGFRKEICGGGDMNQDNADYSIFIEEPY